jgi:CheY-like chemotaxis protein/HPt (histidine-containing phosphotransfer) domain-containing protein
MLSKPVFEGDVLLCDDNRMNQDLISDRLTRVGLKTTVAKDGKEGVEEVVSRVQNSKKHFDLIFMDIHMPVMDGVEATAEILKLNTGTPIIAMTANSNPSERVYYIEQGMSDCVNKPFTSQDLLACLTKYLKPQTFDPMDENNAEQESRDEEKLKIRLINHFLKNNKTIYPEITGALDQGDIVLAHRLAHTLKSSAGILGKTRLQGAAENVEHLLENKENRTNQSVLNILKTELDAAINELEPLAAKGDVHGEGESGGTLGEEETRALFEKLEALLDGGDTECLNLIGSLRLVSGNCGPVVHGPTVHGPTVRELIQQIEYFEFDTAMETLVRLKGERYMT